MLDKVVEKYSIQAPTYTCSSCPTEIARGGEYFSAILFEEETFLRREVCPACWEKRIVDTEVAYAYWKTRRPEPRDRPARRRFDIELLWEFFVKLEKDLAEEPVDDGEPEPPPRQGQASDEDPERSATPDGDGEGGQESDADAATEEAESRPPAPLLGREEKARLCFLLALLLLRGKRFVLRGTVRRDGAELLRLAEKAHPETEHLVEDPQLAREDLERVKQSLGELLQMEI